MKLATLPGGGADGQLVVVSRDLRRAVAVGSLATSMLDAVTRWAELAGRLAELQADLESGRCAASFDFDAGACLAPLPRTWQWLDGSAFLHHGRLMERAFRTPPIPEFETVPLLYQGAGDDMLGPCVDVAFADHAHGIDFEGEFGVVVDDVPMGVSADEALGHVLLCVQLNDWSLRTLGAREMRTGFGFVQAKPSTSFAPVAVTPDELGRAWRHGRLALELHVEWNQHPFGRPSGAEMHFHFGELIAHAAATRRLSAGTIIGSGTVSNADPEAGSACIAERRVLEILREGCPKTRYMAFGDRVRMQARHPAGAEAPFGAIDQRIVRAI